jgi:hypothetical protein
MRTAAKPRVNFYVQVPPEVDNLRRRLQAKLGYSAGRLAEDALKALEDRLDAESKIAEGEIAA